MTGRVRASRQEQVGGAGVSEVSAAFERLGWGVVENSRHDLGTDLFVLARDERLFDLGMVVGVQVKTGGEGSRYFREPVRDDEGHLRGWWFRDDDRRHVGRMAVAYVAASHRAAQSQRAHLPLGTRHC